MAAYGHKVLSDDDILVKQMENASYVATSVGTPGSTVVDFFPFCTLLNFKVSYGLTELLMFNHLVRYLPLWLPGMHLMRKLREGRAYIKQALEIPLDVVRKEHVRIIYDAWSIH